MNTEVKTLTELIDSNNLVLVNDNRVYRYAQ